MTELKEWPLSLLVAFLCFVGAMIALAIGIGYLAGPGWGWIALTVELAILAKQTNDIYMEERKLEKDATQ